MEVCHNAAYLVNNRCAFKEIFHLQLHHYLGMPWQ